MKAWEHIINIAMLGTDKPAPGNADFPDEVMAIAEHIDAVDELDKESKFLHKAALVYNYRQCGFVPLQKQDLPVNTAAPETRPYCNDDASNVLNGILDEDNLALLELWLNESNRKEQLLRPEVLPTVLDKLYQNPFLRPSVIACSGNRGAWLSQFNPQWDYFTQLPDEELWQTGKPEDRVKLLQKIRQTTPDMAREWLQQTWEQENAASKAELMKVLRINSGPGDLPWLESLQGEKGQKVKDEVLELLKLIPGSGIIKQYEAILSKAVILKKEKALLGMMNKTSIHLQLPDKIDEVVFKSGIQKMTGQKSNFSDHDFIIYQLIGFVPPTFWETQFGAAPAQVVEYFEKYAAFMVGALGSAVSRFGEKNWMPYFLHHSDKFFIDFINYLPASEQEKYLLKFFDGDQADVIHHAFRCNHEWGLTFATSAIKFMANNPYQYNRGFYGQNIKLIPVEVLSQLEKIESKEANMQSTWEKTRAHLTKLLTLKQQTLQAFNA